MLLGLLAVCVAWTVNAGTGPGPRRIARRVTLS